MLQPNEILRNRYRIEQQLGQGGMGAVYKAVDLTFGSTVAIKETIVEGEAHQRAFEREARLLNGLRHKALPVVSDYFLENNRQFLVMQFIPGEDLGQKIARKQAPVSTAVALDVVDQLLETLTYLHSRQPPILHRDIKPQNIKLTPEGDVILIDFGLAKGSLEHMTRLTEGSIAGYTPYYAALEQIRGQGTDVRSDLYSVAATAYYLVTCRLPVDAVSRADAAINGEPDPLRPVHEVNPAVSQSVSAELAKALSLRRDERHASAWEMRRAFQEAATRTDSPTVPTLPMPPEPDTAEGAQAQRGTVREAQKQWETVRGTRAQGETVDLNSPTDALPTRNSLPSTPAKPTVPMEPARATQPDRGVTQHDSSPARRADPAIPLKTSTTSERTILRALLAVAALVLVGAAAAGVGYMRYASGESDRVAATDGAGKTTGASTTTPNDSANRPAATPPPAVTPAPDDRSNDSSQGQVAAANRQRDEDRAPAVTPPAPRAPETPAKAPSGEHPSEPPKIIRLSGGALAGKATKRVTPSYPAEAQQANIEGTVVVELTISEAGSVIAAKTVSGNALLRPAAESAARQWQFSPTLVSGVPVKVVGPVSFVFKNKSKKPSDLKF